MSATTRQPEMQGQLVVASVTPPRSVQTKNGVALVADVVDGDGNEWSVWGQERIGLLAALAGQTVQVRYTIGQNGKPNIRGIGGAQQQMPQQQYPQQQAVQQPIQTYPGSGTASTATPPAIPRQSNQEVFRQQHIARCTALKCAVELFPQFAAEDQNMDTLLRTAEVMRVWLDGKETPAPGQPVQEEYGQTDDIPF